MGKSPADDWPTVKVPPQDPMRVSLGCILSILSPFLNSWGRPSKLPIRHTIEGFGSVDAILLAVLLPAVTVTVSLATSYSPLYNFMVYVPDFIKGDLKVPPLALVQYWA